MRALESTDTHCCERGRALRSVHSKRVKGERFLSSLTPVQKTAAEEAKSQAAAVEAKERAAREEAARKAEEEARELAACEEARKKAEEEAKKKAEEEAAAAAECVVCFKEDGGDLCVFVPCGHLCVCAECAEKIMASSKQCPMCNGVAVWCGVMKEIYRP